MGRALHEPHDPPLGTGAWGVMTLEERAREFAIKRHGAQKYGGRPYADHLDDVHAVLVEFGCDDEELLAAAYLHDVIEDANTFTVHIVREFNLSLGQLVWKVTNERGGNRIERHLKTYPKIRSDARAVQLKLADRIANVRRGVQGNDGLLWMYRKEYAGFKAALFRDGEFVEMWTELERICGPQTDHKYTTHETYTGRHCATCGRPEEQHAPAHRERGDE